MERGTMPAGWWSAGAAMRLFKTTLLLQKVVEGDDKRLIWFFLAGWISGAVFMILYARWWVHRHMVKVTPEEAMKDINEMKEDETHE